MRFHHKIKAWRSLDNSRPIKKSNSLKKIKSRRFRSELGLERKTLASAHVKDIQSGFIATFKRRSEADHESPKYHGIFDRLMRKHVEPDQEAAVATVATSNSICEGEVDESIDAMHTTGPMWMCNCTAVMSESGGDDSRPRTAAQEAAPNVDNDGNAPESALDTLVTGWDRALCCLGWGSSRQLVDRPQLPTTFPIYLYRIAMMTIQMTIANIVKKATRAKDVCTEACFGTGC